MDTAEARVRAAVERELASELARRGSGRLGLGDQDWLYRMVGRMVADEQRRTGAAGERAEAAELWRRVYTAVSPLGPLAEQLADPEVEEVRINGSEACFVIRNGRRERVPVPFEDADALIALVQWYADGAGSARLDRSSPTVTLTLPDGSRLHAALSPPARPLAVTIRRHVVSRFGCLADLAAAGLASTATMDLLEAMVKARLNILIAGGTGAGKTTLARALCRAIPPEERVITIEDQAELHVWQDLADGISLEGRPANSEGRGAISIQMLVHEALRMSPDRIVIGEVRGGEALDLLDAMNTGHPGSICTLHSDSPRETLPRLARLALRNAHAPRPEAIAAEIVRAVDVVLHLVVLNEGGTRRRHLRSIGMVSDGLDGWVEELTRNSVRRMPARMAAGLAAAGFDAGRVEESIDG